MVKLKIINNMRIGIVGPFNPASIADYLEEVEVPFINGAATAVNTMAYEFLSQGHKLKIFTLTTSNSYEVIKGRNVKVFLIPSGIFPKLIGSRQLTIGQFYQPQRIAEVIKKEICDIDILHAHWTYEYGRAASYFSENILVYDTVRDWCPYQMTVQKSVRNFFDWKLKHINFRKVMAHKDITFIANSNYTFSMIKGSYPEKNVPVIPNPIDKRWILECKKYQTKHRIISIATGLFSPRKNIRRLLDAFAMYRQKYTDATLHLVGNYDEESAVYKTWEQNGLLSGVVMHGVVSHSKLMELLDQMSCLVHPALEETFGNILLEAMSRCIPCVGGNDSGAVPEVLGHGKYGLLCDITNPVSIYEAMLKLDDQELSSLIQAQSTEMLKKTCSSDIVVKKHIELFENNL